MDTLFTTELLANGNPETYSVSFQDDSYVFQNTNSQKSFSLRREEDEWHSVDSIDNQLKNAAIEKLESYLLSQH